MQRKRTWYSVLSTRYLVLWLTLALLSAANLSHAAPPKLNNLLPTGGQKGQTIAVTAAGEFSSWPVEVWADRMGVKATAEKEKGKFRVEVAADAVPGTYWLRAFNGEGASVLKPFVVGMLPEVAESEPNDVPEKPQTVAPRVVVNGKLGKTGDVDGYRVELKQGETLVASLVANSVLGAPMDAMLQVCELVERSYAMPAARVARENAGSADGEVAKESHQEADASRSPRPVEAYVVAQNHDAVGLDPQIAFTAPREGTYLVRVFAFPATPDSSVRFAGGDDYLYRLTLTTGPFIDHALPLAVPREESQVQLGGWNLKPDAMAVVPPFSAEVSLLTPPDGPVAWVGRADAAGAVALTRQDGNGTRSVPTTDVSGRLATSGQVDSVTIQGKKNEKLRIRVAAKAMGFPTDAVVSVLDEAGKSLAEADDTGRDDRDPQLEFMPPADGKYTVTVRDLARRGDLRMVYRLTVEPVLPDYSLTLAADSFVIEKDKPLEITVNLAVRDGLREPIEVRAVGLPAGVTAEPVKFVPSGDSPTADAGGGRRGKRSSTPAPSGPSVKLILKANAAVAVPGGAAFRIEGRTMGSSPIVRTARFSLILPLAGQHYAAWLTVK